MGINCHGERDVLGLWMGTGGEGAKHWMGVLAELKNRGIADVCIACCDGLKGLPEAINQIWPQATVQQCVVHRGRQESTCWFSGAGMLWWCVGRGEEVGGRGVAVVGGGDGGV
ncbi:transposase, partial [Actinoallomurus sp. WRP9H-5]|uniref:transposase n=1 Tax=Actinoallomurus rhizosphaericola TaxID=2952536 RepID=UPI00209327EC